MIAASSQSPTSWLANSSVANYKSKVQLSLPASGLQKLTRSLNEASLSAAYSSQVHEHPSYHDDPDAGCRTPSPSQTSFDLKVNRCPVEPNSPLLHTQFRCSTATELYPENSYRYEDDGPSGAVYHGHILDDDASIYSTDDTFNTITRLYTNTSTSSANAHDEPENETLLLPPSPSSPAYPSGASVQWAYDRSMRASYFNTCPPPLPSPGMGNQFGIGEDMSDPFARPAAEGAIVDSKLLSHPSEPTTSISSTGSKISSPLRAELYSLPSPPPSVSSATAPSFSSTSSSINAIPISSSSSTSTFDSNSSSSLCSPSSSNFERSSTPLPTFLISSPVETANYTEEYSEASVKITVVSETPPAKQPTAGGRVPVQIVQADCTGSPSLNFSRPYRPSPSPLQSPNFASANPVNIANANGDIKIDEERKRVVLERNSHRIKSPTPPRATARNGRATPGSSSMGSRLDSSSSLGAYSYSGKTSPTPSSVHTTTSLSINISSSYRSQILSPPSSSASSRSLSSSVTSSSALSPTPGHIFSNASSSSSSYSNSAYHDVLSKAPQSSIITGPTRSSSASVQTRMTSRSIDSRGPPSPTRPQKYLQLGIMHHKANRLPESGSYFKKSAIEDGGCPAGMLMWGLSLRHAWGCEKDEQQAFKWIKKAAESAVEALEEMRRAQADKVERDAVKSELAAAVHEVGQSYYHGWGVPKDKKIGVSYYKTAAELGNPDAQQDLAFCLANGKGCRKDKKDAAKWYRAAAEQGADTVGLEWIFKPKYAG